MSDMKVAILLTALIFGGLALLAFVNIGHEELIVVSREAKSEFACSGFFPVFGCRTEYYYFVNGNHASSTLYNEVEEGKSYDCERTLLGGLVRCKELEAKND